MKRRSFLQYILGFLALPFVPKAKAKPTVVITNGIDTVQKWAQETIFVGYHIVASGNRIKWSEINYDTSQKWGYIDLPTYNVCEKLIVAEGHLFWMGAHREVWEIVPTMDEMVFQFRKVGHYCFNYLIFTHRK